MNDEKEMLARNIEKSTQGKLEQLSDRLTTPNLSQNEKNKIFEIIKSWQNISQEIISNKNKNNTSDRIKKIRETLIQKPELASHFKLKS